MAQVQSSRMRGRSLLRSPDAESRIKRGRNFRVLPGISRCYSSASSVSSDEVREMLQTNTHSHLIANDILSAMLHPPLPNNWDQNPRLHSASSSAISRSHFFFMMLSVSSQCSFKQPSSSPSYRTPIPKEATRRTVVSEGGGPHGGVCAFFDGAGGVLSAHVGLDPAGADGVDEDSAAA